MPIFTPDKPLRDLPKTPVILNVILRGVDQARAQSATDGPDGWSVLEVLCHLNDYEQIFNDRVRLILGSDLPLLPGYNQLELVKTNHYADQNFAEVFASYVSRRRALLALLRGLSPEQWNRRGVHSVWGEVTIVEQMSYVPTHDLNHIEQIIKALGTSPDLTAL